MEKKFPISIVHFITGQCNARCAHCFVDFEGGSSKAPSLSLEEIRKLAASFGPTLYNVNLTGGEPFIRRDIWEIAEAYFEHSPIQSIMITSNGHYTDRTLEFVEKFLGSSFSRDRKITFSISLDNFPEKHDQFRKVRGLFERALETYRQLEALSHPNVMPNIALTVADHNCVDVVKLYSHLRDEAGVRAFTATAMREAGVVAKIPPEVKREIHAAYTELCGLIQRDQAEGKTVGFKRNLHGRLMNAKNRIVNEVIQDTYLVPAFRTPCPAGVLFGVIGHEGTVFPCEILDRPLGNLKDYGMNFLELWKNQSCRDAEKFIRESHCNCTYECAWTLNVISNPSYLPRLIQDVVRQ